MSNIIRLIEDELEEVEEKIAYVDKMLATMQGERTAYFHEKAILVALKEEATPDKEKGHWVKHEVRGQEALCCSKCGSGTGTIYEYAFCPNCGIEMDGDRDE